MANIHCKCGKSFSDGEIPCKYQYYLIPDAAIQGIGDRVVSIVKSGTEDDDGIEFAIIDPGKIAYECPYCKRLIVFWQGLDEKASSYKLE